MSFHTAQTFTFGETPSATKWNYIWENDYALQDWSAYTNDTFPQELIPNNEITLEKLNASVAFLATHSSSQNTGNGAFAAMSFNTESFDYGSDFASSEFTAPVNGFYFFFGRTHTTDANTRLILALFTNTGSGYAEALRGVDHAGTGGGAGQGPNFAGGVYLDAGDTAKMYSFGNAALSLSANLPNTYFGGFLVGMRT
jgi:hypothetical protein